MVKVRRQSRFLHRVTASETTVDLTQGSHSALNADRMMQGQIILAAHENGGFVRITAPRNFVPAAEGAP